MAKIILNNKEFNIDDAVIASINEGLKNHLLTTMSGSGATITLDGVAYNIDSTKLATAKNDFVAHLGTIAGEGAKVVVNGVEYAVDSTKISGAVSELGTAFDELENGTVNPLPVLTAPTIEITENTLNIYDEEGLATSYDILVDGVVKDSVEVPQGYTVDFSALTFNTRGDNCTLTIYDGQDASGIVVYQKTTSDTTFDQLTSYQFTSGYFYITWESGKASGFNSVTATGGATITSRSTSAAYLTYATGTISGDGAISGTLTGDN